jgi:DNA-binding LacI/PurR family transcriptional regulator
MSTHTTGATGRKGGHVRRDLPRVTLQYIADELGISRTTVSNAYNRPQNLSAELLRRVLETADKHGYSGPDPLARKLRTGQASAVGLVFTDSLSYAIRDEAAAGFLQGLALACEEAQTSLLLIPVRPGTDAGLSAVEQAAVDSVVIYSIPNDTPHLRAVLRKNVPVIVVDEPEHVPGVDWVGLDERASFALVAAHLADLGHKNVAVLCHRLSGQNHNGEVTDERFLETTYDVQRNRIEGFRDKFMARTAGGGKVTIIERHMSEIPDGVEAANTILNTHPGITAIACTSDALALGVLIAAQQRGLHVPEDLSVTGFDDIPSAARANLTTVRQPLVEKGRIAGEILLVAAKEPRPRKVVLETSLQIRGSSGRSSTR